LVQWLFIGDQPCPDQFLAGTDQGRTLQRQQFADTIVGVEAQSLAVGDGYQEQVQGQCRWLAALLAFRQAGRLQYF
jgi:hypothetical protein